MRVLQLAIQKIPAMDKLHYYVCETDTNLCKYIERVTSDPKYCSDTYTLKLMKLCSINDDIESDDDDDGNNGNDANNNGDDITDDYVDCKESDVEQDSNNEDDDDNASFVNEAIGVDQGQLRQVLLMMCDTILLFLLQHPIFITYLTHRCLDLWSFCLNSW